MNKPTPQRALEYIEEFTPYVQWFDTIFGRKLRVSLTSSGRAVVVKDKLRVRHEKENKINRT